MSIVVRILLAAVTVATLGGPAFADRLTDAYKREFAFLEAEKQALEQRIAEEKQAAAQRISAARGEIGSLQGQVVALSGEAERLEELLLDAERNLDGLEQSEDVGADLLTRAQAAYERAGVQLPATDDPAKQLEQLAFIFEQAPATLTRQAQIRTEPGAYFDEDGIKVEGPILQIGGVASYGLVEGAMGPLAPAGDERLKLWPTDGGAAVAAALRDGERPGTLPIFLYETLEKGTERRAGKTLEQIMEAGGPVGWVIVFLGALGVLMMLARVILLAMAARGRRRVVQPTLDAIGRGDLDGARAIAHRANNPAGRVLVATIDGLQQDRSTIEDRVAEAVLHEQPRLARFGAAILVIAAVGPLLGLLGTVTGMISTFDIITEFGTGNPKLLSSGISEALVTTELGLIVAIPSLLIGHVLNGWAEKIRDGLDAAALAAVNRASGLRPPEGELARATIAEESEAA